MRKTIKDFFNKVHICRFAKDGGSKSTVWGFYLIEIKPWFSIVFLCFEKGSREDYHSHAFNAYTWFLKGYVREKHMEQPTLEWKGSWRPKYTPRDTFHKVLSVERTYALTFRGPWAKSWLEYRPASNEFVELQNGRKEVRRWLNVKRA